MVSRNTPGKNMRERIHKWHEDNPNQRAKGSLSYGRAPVSTNVLSMGGYQRVFHLGGRAISEEEEYDAYDPVTAFATRQQRRNQADAAGAWMLIKVWSTNPTTWT